MTQGLCQPIVNSSGERLVLSIRPRAVSFCDRTRPPIPPTIARFRHPVFSTSGGSPFPIHHRLKRLLGFSRFATMTTLWGRPGGCPDVARAGWFSDRLGFDKADHGLERLMRQAIAHEDAVPRIRDPDPAPPNNLLIDIEFTEPSSRMATPLGVKQPDGRRQAARALILLLRSPGTCEWSKDRTARGGGQ